MILWKYSPEGDAPIMRRLNWYGPLSGVWNAVIYAILWPMISGGILGKDLLR